MCGRYHVDEETAKEIEKIIQLTEENVRKRASINFSDAGKRSPSDRNSAGFDGVRFQAGMQHEAVGTSGLSGKQVIFNARSESVLDKKTFQEGVAYRRIVIPAAWFYEWNRYKEKNIFYRKGKPVLFMAGIYNHYEDGDRFTILTTQANASMKPIHDRMPLVLEESELIPWIFDRRKAGELLQKVPCLLEQKAEYEQLRLF